MSSDIKYVHIIKEIIINNCDSCSNIHLGRYLLQYRHKQGQ